MKRILLTGTIAAFMLAQAAPAWTQSLHSVPPVKRPFDLPPSADLNYTVKAKQSGFVLDGNNALKWHVAGGRYSIRTETRAMILGKILAAGSEGAIDEYGLAPDTFVEKRVRREASVATFDRTAGTIGFSASKESHPIRGGEQDRSSIVWQLIAHARAMPKKFVAGSEWQYSVVGPHDVDAWVFKVGKTEKIDTTLGQFSAVRVSKVPNERGHKLDIWLAPRLDWYPVRLRQTEPDGDYIEQILENVSKK